MTVKRNIHPLLFSEKYGDKFIELYGTTTVRVGNGISPELISLWDELISNFTAGTVRIRCSPPYPQSVAKDPQNKHPFVHSLPF